MSDTNPAAPPNDLANSTPGEYLRKLREEKGHTHAVVSSALHLTVHYIKALEGDEYGKLPGLTFVKGYLRSYARFLGADVDNVLARFDEHITGLLDAGQHTARIERSKRRQDQALRWAIGAGLVVVAGIAAGWWFMRDAEPVVDTAQRSATETTSSQLASAPTSSSSAVTPPVVPAYTPPPQATTFAEAGQATLVPGSVAEPNSPMSATTQPAGTSPAAVLDENGAVNGIVPQGIAVAGDTAAALPPPDTAAAMTDPSHEATAVITPAANGARQVSLIGAGDDELSVRFTGNSWIEVDDGSMVRLYNDMLSAGDTLTIRGNAPFRVLLGDASSVAVSLNAAPVDFSAEVRADNTARLVLGAPDSGTPVNEGATSAASASETSAPAAAAATNPAASTDAEVSQ
ncbi:MAG: RodZ domain-containing protein [Gammaproteobacteria bacterium]